MKYSIIIPIYNIEQYICHCVDSVINQTYKDIQVVLVDDGSTDCSSDVIEKYKNDKRVIIVHKNNGGLSSARNEGLKHVTGDYVLFVDGDDWLETNGIELIHQQILTMGNVDMLVFSYYLAYSKHNRKIVDFSYYGNDIVDGATFFELSKYRVTAWSKVYKKTFLDQIGLMFLEGRYHEDIPYTIPLIMMAKKVSYLNTPIYNYRQDRQGSIMQQVKEKNVIDFTYALCFVYEFTKNNNCCTCYLSKYLINSFYHSCLTSLTNYKTLRRSMQINEVPKIVLALRKKTYSSLNCRWFYVKLFFTHINHRGRFLLSSLKKNMLYDVYFMAYPFIVHRC